MDILNKSIRVFWESLNKNYVEYIMAGGFATNMHGFQRVTGDMDILLNDTPENRKKLRSAFVDCGMGDFEALETIQFVPGWTTFNLDNGFIVDFMVLPLKGLENLTFEDCINASSVMEIYGLQIPFLHINHLIANKKSVNRPKDQIDVVELEKIKKMKEG